MASFLVVWLLFWWGPQVRGLSSQGLRNQPRRRAKPASVDGIAKSAKSGSGQSEMKPMVGSPRVLVATLGFESDQKPRVSEFGGVRFWILQPSDPPLKNEDFIGSVSDPNVGGSHF